MSNTIGSYEAKTRLPEILRRVKAGESFTITNRGEAIAELVPSEEIAKAKAAKSIRRLKQLVANSNPISNDDLQDLIEEARE